jgi:kinesin family member 3B
VLGNFQNVVDVFPNRGAIEILNPNESVRDSKKIFTYDAAYDAK